MSTTLQLAGSPATRPARRRHERARRLMPRTRDDARVHLNMHAASRASLTPEEAGRMRTILTCKAPHPVRAASHRHHGARLGVAHGFWVPTGRVIDAKTADVHPFEEQPEENRLLVWCHCKHATEYERHVQRIRPLAGPLHRHRRAEMSRPWMWVDAPDAPRGGGDEYQIVAYFDPEQGNEFVIDFTAWDELRRREQVPYRRVRIVVGPRPADTRTEGE